LDKDPTHVAGEDLEAALESLGISDYRRTRRIEIEPGRITVVRYRQLDGRPFVAGRDGATETTEIAIRYPKDRVA